MPCIAHVNELLRFRIKSEPGRIILLENGEINYIEAEGDSSLVRTARKHLHKHVEPLDEVQTRLATPAFFRIHRSYVVNLDRVYELRSRGDDEWDLKMDLPVKKVLPVSCRRMDKLRKLLEI